MTKIAVQAIVVGSRHQRGIWGIGTAAHPALGKMTSFAQIACVGVAECPDRILKSHRKARPENRVSAACAIIEPFQLKPGSPPGHNRHGNSDICLGLRDYALARLSAGHSYIGVVNYKKGNPGVSGISDY